MLLVGFSEIVLLSDCIFQIHGQTSVLFGWMNCQENANYVKKINTFTDIKNCDIIGIDHINYVINL